MEFEASFLEGCLREDEERAAASAAQVKIHSNFFFPIYKTFTNLKVLVLPSLFNIRSNLD
jgi:hypothetical protein